MNHLVGGTQSIKNRGGIENSQVESGKPLPPDINMQRIVSGMHCVIDKNNTVKMGRTRKQSSEQSGLEVCLETRNIRRRLHFRTWPTDLHPRQVTSTVPFRPQVHLRVTP
jgi:hypothetical protein